jgi:hypothetical protein
MQVRISIPRQNMAKMALVVTLAAGQFAAIGWSQSRGMLFYGFDGSASTGRFNPDGSFTSLQYYIDGFGDWNSVTMTYSNMLLFYNSTSGAAAIGYMDGAGNYINLNNLTLSIGWSYITAVGYDMLFFFNSRSGSGATAKIDSGGNFVTLWSYSNMGPWNQLVGTQSPAFLFFSTGESAATAQVGTDGQFSWIEGVGIPQELWGDSVFATNTCPAYCSSFLFFYNPAFQTAASGYLDNAGHFVFLRDLGGGFGCGIDDSWNNVIATQSSDTFNMILLFYDPRSGCGATGYIDSNGWFQNLQALPLTFVPNLLPSSFATGPEPLPSP